MPVHSWRYPTLNRVHLYIKCSDLTLEQAAGFFIFVAGGENSLPGTTETVDVQPFMYSNGELLEVATPESRDIRGWRRT